MIVQANHSEPELVKARRIQWQELSDAARIQFAWAEPRQPRAEANTFNPPSPDPIEPLSNFCLLLLDPVQVDHLELRGEPQNRTIYRRQSNNSDNDAPEWTVQSVNP